MPIVLGHVLVIPKKEIDYIFEVNDDLLSLMLPFAKKVAIAMEMAIPCIRIGISVIGIEVPHTHMHLIPLNKLDDINFSKPKLQVSPDEMSEIAEKIKSFL